MGTLLTVTEVAAYLHVSTETVYRLCALGELRHIRVLNAITMAPSDVDALVGPEPTQLTAGLEVSSCGNRQGPSFVNGSEPQADRQPRLVRADQRQHLHSELLLQLLVVAIRSSRICDASTG